MSIVQSLRVPVDAGAPGETVPTPARSAREPGVSRCRVLAGVIPRPVRGWRPRALTVMPRVERDRRRRPAAEEARHATIVPARARRNGGWSGRRGSNPRHAAWKAAALPAELLPLGLVLCYDVYLSSGLTTALLQAWSCAEDAGPVVKSTSTGTTITEATGAPCLGLRPPSTGAIAGSDVDTSIW